MLLPGDLAHGGSTGAIVLGRPRLRLGGWGLGSNAAARRSGCSTSAQPWLVSGPADGGSACGSSAAPSPAPSWGVLGTSAVPGRALSAGALAAPAAGPGLGAAAVPSESCPKGDQPDCCCCSGTAVGCAGSAAPAAAPLLVLHLYCAFELPPGGLRLLRSLGPSAVAVGAGVPRRCPESSHGAAAALRFAIGVALRGVGFAGVSAWLSAASSAGI